MGAAPATEVALPTGGARIGLAAEGEEGPAAGRLWLHLGDRLCRKPVPPPALGGLDIQHGHGYLATGPTVRGGEVGAGGTNQRLPARGCRRRRYGGCLGQRHLGLPDRRRQARSSWDG